MGGVLGATTTRDYIETLGKDAENIFGTDSFSPSLNIPGLKAVAELARAKLNRMDVGVAAVMADIAVIWDALERAKTTKGKDLRDAIAATDLQPGDRNFFLLRGAKFNDKGDNEKAVSIITQIQHGQFVPVWPTEFAQAPAIYPKPDWS
jgi:branched-chain amino acid transport system substrate-binding protein